jgi:hypothetical protein
LISKCSNFFLQKKRPQEQIPELISDSEEKVLEKIKKIKIESPDDNDDEQSSSTKGPIPKFRKPCIPTVIKKKDD